MVFNRSPGQFLIPTALEAGDSAYQSILAGDCAPSPASDTFGLARVAQELFDAECASRFELDGVTKRKPLENRFVLPHLRPVLKAALKRDPTARAPIENLHTAIVQAYWVNYLLLN